MLDYTAIIQEKTQDFTGRQWVFEALEAWLQDGGPQVFLLTGKPGTGKSAIAARLVQMSLGDVPAEELANLGREGLAYHHFCQATNDPTLDPLRFVEALSLHLANRYSPFAKALLNVGEQDITITVDQSETTVADGGQVTGIVIKSLHIGNVSARIAFDRTVRKPLEALRDPEFGEKIVILVDSLDEALTYGEETITRLLADVLDSAEELPSQVRLILTSRDEPRVAHLLGYPNLDLVGCKSEDVEDACAHILRLDLIAHAPDDVDDVYTYVERQLGALPKGRWEHLARQIAGASKGNFLYAYHVTADALAHSEQLEYLDDLPLPEDLTDVYRQFLERELARGLESWGDRYRPRNRSGVVAQ